MKKDYAARASPGRFDPAGRYLTPAARRHSKLPSQIVATKGYNTVSPLDALSIISHSRNRIILASAITLELPSSSKFTEESKTEDKVSPSEKLHQFIRQHKHVPDSQSFSTPQKTVRPTMSGSTPDHTSSLDMNSCSVRANRSPLIVRNSRDNTIHVYCNPRRNSHTLTTFTNAVQSFGLGSLKPSSIDLFPHKLDLGGRRYLTTDVDCGSRKPASGPTNLAVTPCREAKEDSQWCSSDGTDKQEIVTELSDYGSDSPPVCAEVREERLDTDQINDGIAYVEGGIGVIKTEPNVSPVRRVPSEHLAAELRSARLRGPMWMSSTGTLGHRPLDPELASVRQDIVERRLRLPLRDEAIMGQDVGPRHEHVLSGFSLAGSRIFPERIKEEELEMEATPTDNMRQHTVKAEIAMRKQQKQKWWKKDAQQSEQAPSSARTDAGGRSLAWTAGEARTSGGETNAKNYPLMEMENSRIEQPSGEGVSQG